MTMPTCLHRLSVPLLLAAAGLPAAALAAPADYDCADGSVLNGDFTPRTAQIRYGGQHWTLARVPGSREARYVNSRAGVSVSIVRSQATVQRKGQPELSCKLVVRALRQDAPGQ